MDTPKKEDSNERIVKEKRHFHYHAYYRCSSCKEYCIYDDIATIIMDDDDWENDKILCDDCIPLS